MNKLVFTIAESEEGQRADVTIAKRLGPAHSRTFVKNLIEKGFVTVSGNLIKPRTLLKPRDEVVIALPPPEPSDITPEDIPLKIIYEDDSIIVVDKPAGMVVHPGCGNRKGTLVAALLHRCGKLAGSVDVSRPGIVHRLDKETSGVLVVAKNDKAMRSLARQFQKRAVKKRYVALVKGKVQRDEGVVTGPIGRHGKNRKKMTVVTEGGKEAETAYTVLERFRSFTLLSIEPKTGRTHQIRAHMKHIGHPVAGDRTYGEPDVLPRHALHAERIVFAHPETGKKMEFNSPLPDDIMELVKKLRKKEK